MPQNFNSVGYGVIKSPAETSTVKIQTNRMSPVFDPLFLFTGPVNSIRTVTAEAVGCSDFPEKVLQYDQFVGSAFSLSM